MHRAIASTQTAGRTGPGRHDRARAYGSLVERTALGAKPQWKKWRASWAWKWKRRATWPPCLSRPCARFHPATLASGEPPTRLCCAPSGGRLTEAIENCPSAYACVVAALHRGSHLSRIAHTQMSEPRVCQLHTEAIGQLRKLLPDARGRSAEATRTCHGPGSGAGAEPEPTSLVDAYAVVKVHEETPSKRLGTLLRWHAVFLSSCTSAGSSAIGRSSRGWDHRHAIPMVVRVGPSAVPRALAAPGTSGDPGLKDKVVALRQVQSHLVRPDQALQTDGSLRICGCFRRSIGRARCAR